MIASTGRLPYSGSTDMLETAARPGSNMEDVWATCKSRLGIERLAEVSCVMKISPGVLFAGGLHITCPDFEYKRNRNTINTSTKWEGFHYDPAHSCII